MRREGKLIDRKWAAIFAGSTGAVFLLLAAAGPAMAATGEIPTATASATVTVPTFIEITLNQSAIDFGTQSPGSTDQGAIAGSGYPARIRLTDNTNVNGVNYTIEGSANMTSGSLFIGWSNLSFSNNSTGPNQTLPTTPNAANNYTNFTNYTSVRKPTAVGQSTDRLVYWQLDVPAGQAAGTYATGQVRIRADRCYTTYEANPGTGDSLASC